MRCDSDGETNLAVGTVMVSALIDPDGAGAQSGVDGCCVDENLERRAGLPLRLGDAVKLALREIGAPDQRIDPTVPIDRHQGSLADMAVPGVGESFPDRRFGLLLMPGVETDDEPHQPRLPP